MTAATPNRILANDGGADKTELALKMYAGEVITAFRETNILADKVNVRTIASGKSAQFSN